MATRRRIGFTLIELLVVVAIISILLLLLLPAMNAVREMGRRTQCSNNQRMIALAIIDYDSAHGALPAAVPLCDARFSNALGREADVSCMGPNWASVILGFIDQEPLYDHLVECVRLQWHASDDCASATGHVGRTTPDYLICPSAVTGSLPHRSARTQLDQLSKANYAACLGSWHYGSALDDGRPSLESLRGGAMSVVPIPNFQALVEKTRRRASTGEWKLGHGHGISTKRIKDGMSHTILLSELRAWDGIDNVSGFSEDLRGVWVSPAMGASTYTHKYGPNSQMPDRLNAGDMAIPRTDPMFCELAPASGADAAETWASARSDHRGGVLAAAVDGSVAFYTDDIHVPIWRALATRAAGDR